MWAELVVMIIVAKAEKLVRHGRERRFHAAALAGSARHTYLASAAARRLLLPGATVAALVLCLSASSPAVAQTITCPADPRCTAGIVAGPNTNFLVSGPVTTAANGLSAQNGGTIESNGPLTITTTNGSSGAACSSGSSE